MRNVFDQYSQPENRLTHALAVALHADPKLIRPFLRRVAKVSGPIPRRLRVTEQSVPGEVPADEDEKRATGLPDACIYDEGETWALIIESKVASRLTRDQLDRHVATLKRRDFKTVKVLALTVGDPRASLPNDAVARRWSEVYAWLRRERTSTWAQRAADFMEIAEVRWSGGVYLMEGTLTEFAGYKFSPDNPFGYKEAKRIQRLAMDELRKFKLLEKTLGADLSTPGRSAITGSKTASVWDYIPLEDARKGEPFTRTPHLTHGMNSEEVDVMLTFPNGVRTDIRRNIVDLGEEGFLEAVLEVERKLRPVLRRVPGSQPLFRAVQRHFHSQRAKPTLDALVRFDLRTALPKGSGRAASRVQSQPIWLSSVYQALAHRRGNFQIQIGAVFPFGDGQSRLATAEALEIVADTWVATKPMLWAALGK